MASLFTADRHDTRGLNWTYLSYGPFERFEEYRDWLEQQSRGDDPLFFAIVNGDLSSVLDGFDSIDLRHQLESVTI